MIKEIQDYFAACPLLSGMPINIDRLLQSDGSVSISPDGGESIIKRYKTGGSLRQYRFTLSLRSSHRTTPADGLRNEQLCEELAEWAEAESERGALPVLKEGLTAQKLEVTSGGFVKNANTSYMHYAIELRLVYTKI